MWRQKLAQDVQKHLSPLTVPSSAIVHFPIYSSPLTTLKISGLAMHIIWLWEGLDQTESAASYKKILLKEVSYCMFDFRFEGHTLLKFKSSQIFAFFMIVMLFLQSDILISVPVNQHEIRIFSPTQIVIHKGMISLMLSQWNWHHWY